jgi:Tfp pilus assembly protein PilW
MMMSSRLHSDTAGYSLVELLVALGVTSVIMGATMVGLTDAVRANDGVIQITGMNNMLRASMDLMVLDLMQAGAGLPRSHTISKPLQTMFLPGPPDSQFTLDVNNRSNLPAVIPGLQDAPAIDDQDTDTISVLFVDDDFAGVRMTTVTATTVALDPDADRDGDIEAEEIAAADAWWNGPGRVMPGQLMMVREGSPPPLSR